MQELAERKAELLKKTEPKREGAGQASRDTRSVEELLSFIEKEGQESQGKKKAKKKPKKKRDTSMDQGSREREAGSDYAHQMERSGSGCGKLPHLDCCKSIMRPQPSPRMMQADFDADFQAKMRTTQSSAHPCSLAVNAV